MRQFSCFVFFLFLAAKICRAQSDTSSVIRVVDQVTFANGMNSRAQDSLLSKAVDLAWEIGRKDYVVRILQYHSFLSQQQNEVLKAKRLAQRSVHEVLSDSRLKASVTAADAIVNLVSVLQTLGQEDSCLLMIERGKVLTKGRDAFNHSLLLSFEAISRSINKSSPAYVLALFDSASKLANQTASLQDDVMASFNKAIFLLGGTPEQCGQAIELLTSFDVQVDDPDLTRRLVPPYVRMAFRFRNPKNTLYTLLAMTYLSMSELDVGAMYMERVVNNYLNDSNPYLHYVMYDLAAVNVLRKDFTTARALYDSALNFQRQQEGRDSINYASYHFLNGRWAEDRKQYHQALYHYRRAAAGPASFFSAFCIPALLRMLTSANVPRHQVDSLVQSLSEAPLHLNSFIQVEFLRELATYYRKQGDSLRYKDTLIRFYLLKDSLTTVTRFHSIREAENRFLAREKDRELALHLKEIAQRKQQTTFLVTGLTALTILLLLILWLYWDKQRRAGFLAEKNHKIEMLIRELHHRVKNNMQTISSLMSLQVMRVKDEQTKLVLQEGQERVDAMALIHQKLYLDDNLTWVDMNEYLALMTAMLANSYGIDQQTISYEVTLSGNKLDVDAAIPLALIINETVTNAFKYAFPKTESPHLHITLTERDNEITLQISDNGPGLNAAIDPYTTDTFGLRLIRTLAQQLKADYAVIIHTGTRFSLTFTIPQ